MDGVEGQTLTTENEVPRRLAKLEEAVAAHTAKHKDPFDKLTPMIAIVALGGLEGLAIYRELDGAMFAPVVAAIAALAGVKFRDIFGDRK